MSFIVSMVSITARFVFRSSLINENAKYFSENVVNRPKTAISADFLTRLVRWAILYEVGGCSRKKPSDGKFLAVSLRFGVSPLEKYR